MVKKQYYVAQKYRDIVDKFKGDEKVIAESLLDRYLRDYSLETTSDVNTLKEVIYYEVIQQRLQQKLNSFADNQSVPIQLVEIMHKNSDVIVKLKNTLGLFAEREKKTEYDVLAHMKRRFKVWLNENQASRTLACPHCGKMMMLKLKTEAWEAMKHPFFRDKVLYNYHLIKLYQESKITRDDVSKVLECSPDYVDWVITKIEKEKQIDGKQEQTEERKEEVKEDVQLRVEINENSGADSQTENTSS